jgi:hypothetical protein
MPGDIDSGHATSSTLGRVLGATKHMGLGPSLTPRSDEDTPMFQMEGSSSINEHGWLELQAYKTMQGRGIRQQRSAKASIMLERLGVSQCVG